MKKFTLRQFQNSPMKCLKSGVCIVTRYNVPLFMVTKLEGITQQVEESLDKKQEKNETTQQTPQQVEEFSQEKARECDIQFCRHEAVEEADWYEYDMGVGYHKQRMWLCEEHLKKARKDAEAWSNQ